MGEETDGVVTSVSILEEEVKALTNINGSGGVKILEDDGKTFRSIYDIYVDISKVISWMSDIDQSALLELIAGKQRASGVLATLNNMSEAQEIYQNSLNSTGSAQREYDKYLASSEASLNKFKASMTETYQSIINGETAKDILDSGNAVLKFANSINLVESAIKGFVAVGIVKFITALSTAFKVSTVQLNNFGVAMNTVTKMSSMTRGTVDYTNALTSLKDASSSLSATQLKHVLANQSLSNSERIAILQTTGLTKAQSRAKLAQMNLTASTRRQTVANGSATASTFNLTAAVKGLGTNLKLAFMSNPIGMTIMAITIFASAFNKLISVTSTFNNVNEKLEKRISSLKDKYSEYSSSIDDINSKIEENKKRIEEILALDTPTYVDKKDLERLKEQNQLLQDNLRYKQEAKDETARKANEALDRQFQREFITNDARNEELTRTDGLLEGVTFKAARGSIKALTNQTTEYDELTKYLDTLSALSQVKELLMNPSDLQNIQEYQRLVDEYNSTPNTHVYENRRKELEKLIQEVNDNSTINLSQYDDTLRDILQSVDITNVNDIDSIIAKNTEALKKYRQELLEKLSLYDETDPNYESWGAKMIIGFLDNIDKFLNPDEWIQSTVDKIYNTESFSEITNAISDKLSNGEKITYEDLLSDESYNNLVKRISLALYNAADDESLKKAASYLFSKISSLITNTVYMTFDEAFGELTKDVKEKLLDLATSGELSAKTISSTDEYKTLLADTGLTADELVDKISKLNVEIKTQDVEELSSVLTKVQSGASFSATEIAELVSKNDDLAKSIIITADGYSLEEDAVVSLMNSNISLYNTSVANEINRTQTQIESTKTRIKALKEEMDVISKVTTATNKASTSPILAQNGFYGSIFGGVANDMGNLLNDSAQKQIESSEKELNELNAYMEQLFKDPFKQEKESSKDTTTVFDWIETRIDRIQRSFEKMVNSVTKYVSSHFKLDTIGKEMSKIDEQISTYQQAAQRYLDEANRVSLSSDLKNKVINGEIDITTISDENTSKAINDFKTWYEKYLDSIDNIVNLQNDKRDKLREKMDARLFTIQTDRERLSVKSDKWQDKIDYKESLGGNAYVNDYRWMINNATQQYSGLNSENTILKDYLHTLDKTSEEWADIQSKIESNEASMRDIISNQTEWNNKIAQIPIEKAERTIDKLSSKAEYLNAKYNTTTSSYNQREINHNLAKNIRNELSAYRESYNTTSKNFSTAKNNINQMKKDSTIISKVQSYTKSGKEIPSDVLASVYGSGNVQLINRVNQYVATLTAKQTAYDTYKLNKELTKSELSDIGQKNLETISNAYSNKYTTLSNKKSYLSAQKDKTEASGKYVTSTYYKQMIAQTAKEINAKMEEQKKLQSIIDKNVKDGLWTKSSQAYKDAKSQVEQLKTEIVELATEQKNYNKELNQLPINKIQTALDILDKLANRDSSKNSLKKAQGKDLSLSDYQKELNNYQTQINKTLALRDISWGRYWDAKKKGQTAKAEEYLQKYYEQGTAINNLKTSYEELKDTMRDDVYWRDLERMHKVAENLKNTLSSLSDLFNDDMMLDDNGHFTDMAIAKIGTLVKQYETAQKEIQNYTNDIKNLNQLYSKGLYTEDEYKEKLAELQDGLLNATKDVKSYTDSITELYISQKDAELDALNELIDKRKEALNAKKSYYDYDKTIKSKTKDIKSLQSQIQALEGVQTAEAKAQLARYKRDLQEAQEDLEDTKFEHKVELIVNGFDSLQTELQENHDEYIKSLKSSFDKQIGIIESANSVYAESYKQIISSMTKMLEYYGVDTSTIKVKSLAGFAEGGIVKQVHKNGDTALASIKPGETVLTDKFTDILPYAVNTMENFLKPQLPNYDKILSSMKVREAPNVTMHYDTLMTVNGDMVDLEKSTMNIVNNNMKTIAKGVSKDFSNQLRKMTK